MHVLFSETVTGASGHSASALAAAGHTIHRCHDPRDLGIVCAALRGRDCPLEANPIDVAVSVRTTDGIRPQPGDDGVFCAIRHHVPLVVAGEAKTHPFLRFPHARSHTDDAELIAAVRRAASGVLPQHSDIATAEARRCAGNEASATVRRVAGGLKVSLTGTGDAAQRASVRVAGVLRKFDHQVRSIDISAT